MDVNLLIAALSGFLGAILLTILIYVLKLFGQKLDIPFLIGTRFVALEHTTQVYAVGIISHLIIGAAWGVLYVTLLTGLAITPNWPAGILWGLAHGIFIGTMMGILAESHPYIGEGKPISDPGVLGQNWGTAVPYWFLLLHIIFGASTLAIYYQLVLA